MDSKVDVDRQADQLGGKPSETMYCDVVMKGGITSGVVFPKAIVELSKKYRLKNIGGTSAGAIAAGIAAAAEYSRASGGFDRMLKYSDQVSTLLLGLFQPKRCFRPLFNAFLVLLGKKSWLFKAPQIIFYIAIGYWFTSFIGSLPAIGLGIYVFRMDNHWVGWLAVVLVAFLGVVVTLTVRICRVLLVELPRNYFGVCSGTKQNSRCQKPALTEWLADALDDIAGLKSELPGVPNKPLTFGDLMGDDSDNPQINLEMMTTNLTEVRPYRLPFSTNIFMYSPNELRKFFPERIVDWMDEHSKPVTGYEDYHWLPSREHLPVIVAVRMSLSFPILLSAIPLYARDFSLPTQEERDLPRRQVFSDGGIGSNFPIHFFDQLWPQWPTFGIKLDAYRPQVHKDERVAIFEKAGQGQSLEWVEIETIGEFAGGILNAFLEWRDNLQSILPGYRERIVHVRLDESEGGLNLNMPAERVAGLSAYGQKAGEVLRDKFNWDEHRWRRYLVSVAAIESVLSDLHESYVNGAPLDESFQDFLGRFAENPTQYKQTKKWREAAKADINDLMQCFQQWDNRPHLNAGAIPKPDVDVRLTPKAI